MPADTVLLDAQVLTMEPALPRASALAIRNGSVVALGNDDEISRFVGAATNVYSMSGRTVVPGFIDTHAHMDREGLRRWYPSLASCESIADVREIVAAAVAERRPGEWIVTSPLGTSPFHLNPHLRLKEGRYPDRYDLDRDSPDNPVWIRSIWGLWSNEPPFVHVLNSAALHACGIDTTSSSPSSTVTIERDANGELTGRILESSVWPAAEFTVLRRAPRFTTQIRTAALRQAIQLHLAAGTTSVFEGHGVASELYDVYRQLHENGELSVRVVAPVSPAPWSSMADAERQLKDIARYASGAGSGDAWLRRGGVYLEYGGDAELSKIMQDAWPYTGWAGFESHALAPDEYSRLCSVAARLQLRVCTVIGTQLEGVLDTWDRVSIHHRIDHLRWVLVHGRFIDPARDFSRIKRLGAVLTTQPSSYIYRSGQHLIEDGGDPNRLMAHRDYIDAKIPWSLSTDNKPYRMLFALWCAVARIERTHGRCLGLKQRVSVEEGLRAMTAAGSYASFSESVVGSLAIGKGADLVALSADPLTLDVADLDQLEVVFTMVGGKPLYSAL